MLFQRQKKKKKGIFHKCHCLRVVFQMVKNLVCNAGNVVSIPGLGRFPGLGHSNPLQYSCLENPMDRAAWWATVQGVTKRRKRLSD